MATGGSRLGSTGPDPPRFQCVLRSRLLTFFMKMVSCREHLSTFSFRIEMSLRVLRGDKRGHLSPGVRPAGLMSYHWALPQSLAVLMSPCVLPPRFLA